jgi:hypothetical protein
VMEGAGGWELEDGSWELEAGSWDEGSETGSWELGSDSSGGAHGTGAGSWELGAGSWEDGADSSGGAHCESEAGAGATLPVAGDCLSGRGALEGATLPVSLAVVSGWAGAGVAGVKVIVGAFDCSMLTGAGAGVDGAVSSGGTHAGALVTAPSLGAESSGGTHPEDGAGAAGASLEGLACSSSGGTHAMG